jgi:hypothetical protein
MTNATTTTTTTMIAGKPRMRYSSQMASTLL